MAWGMMAWHRCPTLLSTYLPRAGDFSYWGRGRVGVGRGRAIYGWLYLWHTHEYWHYPYGTRMAGGMYGDNCGIFAGKARPAPHLIQPCPEWCVHTSLLIQPQLHRPVNSLRFTAHLGRVLLVHMKPLSPARNIHRKISGLMGKSIAYQSTIAIEVTECKCVNATLHRKRDFILLPNALSKVESY